MNENSPKFFIVAGEQSGDLHGSKLIDSIKKQYPKASFVGHGGDRRVLLLAWMVQIVSPPLPRGSGRMWLRPGPDAGLA